MEDWIAAEILIVEDNPHDAELMIRAIKKNNIANKFFIAEDGEEALDFIFCRNKFTERSSYAPPRVIFLDLKLPKVNGLEVLQVIKSDSKTKTLLVVMITSSREDTDIKKAYELGANSYVVKPVNFNDFYSAMSNTGLYWLLVNVSPKS